MKQPGIKLGLQMTKYHCRPISCSRHTIGMFTVGATECRSTQALAFLQMFYTSNYSKMKKKNYSKLSWNLAQAFWVFWHIHISEPKGAVLWKLVICMMGQHVRHGLALAQHGDKWLVGPFTWTHKVPVVSICAFAKREKHCFVTQSDCNYTRLIVAKHQLKEGYLNCSLLRSLNVTR